MGFSLHSIFKLDEHYGRNDFFCFFKTHFIATSPFVLWISLYTLFSGMILFYFFSEPILTLLPIRNPQNKYKTKGEKSLLCRNPIFRRCATAGRRSEPSLPSALCLRLCPLLFAFVSASTSASGVWEQDPSFYKTPKSDCLFWFLNIFILFWILVLFFCFLFLIRLFKFS